MDYPWSICGVSAGYLWRVYLEVFGLNESDGKGVVDLGFGDSLIWDSGFGSGQGDRFVDLGLVRLERG